MPEATAQDQKDAQAHAEPQKQLVAKGLPALAARRGKEKVMVSARKIWHFMLEAKGLRQNPSVSYKIKKMLKKGGAPADAPAPIIPPPTVEEQGEDYLLEQIKKFPKDLEGYNKLGTFYIDSNAFEDAKNVYDYLVKHDPAHGEYWARLGFSQLQQREYENAIESYGKALVLDSSHPNRYYSLAQAHIELRQWDHAAKALRKALDLEPNNVKYMHVLADVYNRMNRPEQARLVSRQIARFDSASQNDKDSTNPSAGDM